MKKVISALLVAVLVFSMIPITVSAIGTAVFSLNVVEETNDKVTVVVNLDSGEFKAVDFKVKGTSDKIGSCVYVIETDDFLEFLKTVKRSGGSGTSGGNSDNGLFGAAVTTAYKGGSIAEYTFKKNSSGKVTSEDLALTVTSCESTLGKITVTTEWHESSYMISYNPNGGSVSPTSEMVEYNKSVKLPSPTRKGYNCLGWANSGSASKADYACGASYTVKDKTTLYAVWQANTYTVVFYATDGNVNVDKKTVTYDSAYGTLPVPTRPGYTFTGWFTEPNGGTEITADKKVAITANQTLYAHWTANTYTVTLDANGGSCSTDKITVTYNSAYSSLPNPTRTGYSFDGWYTAKEGGSQVTSGAKVTITSNQTLYAHWNADVYIITLDANGGSSLIKSKTVSYNSTYGTLPTATRTGYSFDGWYTEADGGTKVTSSSKLVKSGSHTLYAHWSASKYTVSFNGNGGNASSSSKSVTYNSTYGTLPTASRTGYTFDGWYTAKDGGNKVTEDTKFTSTSNQTLYAHWKANTYTVSFNLNGGSGSADSKTVSYGSTYGTLPTVSRTGYGFDGWYTDANGGTKITSDTKVAITSNQTLYAHWKLNTYTVSFNGNGGNASSSSKSVTYNSTYGTLPTATRTGYTFDGWYTEANGGTKVTADTKVAITSNQTLYAHWKVNAYTVSFNGNGGNASSSSKSVTYNSTYGTLPTATRTGYTFDGWYTEANGGTKVTADTKVAITSNQTLYAHWKLNTYTVSFNGNGGNASASSKSVTYNSTYGTLPTATRTGYAFDGWYTEANGGTKISADTKVAITSNQTLYAHWTINVYTVTYNANGGSVSTSSAKVEHGKSVTLPTPTRPGYTCRGWSTNSSDQGASFACGASYSPTSNITLYAVWRKNVSAPVVTTSNIAETGKIKVSWNAVDDAVSYNVYRATKRDGIYTLKKNTASTSYINTSTKVGKSYYYKVQAVAKDGTLSEFSEVVVRTCDLPRPVVTGSNIASTGKIKLTWEAIEGAVSYKIYRSTTKDGSYNLMKTTTSTSYINTSAAAGTTYYYKVKAVAEKSAANSAYSKIVTRTCDCARPVVTATNVASTGKVKLSWDAVDGAVSYNVYRATSKNGTYAFLKNTTSTTLTNTSTVAGVTYYYKVKAVASNTAGNSAESKIVTRTCDLASPKVTTSLTSSGKPKLTWNTVDGAVSYKVYRSTSENGTYTLMKTTTSTTYTNTSAVKGTTYYYRVKAVCSNSAGDSAYAVVKAG